jgi:2-polyprenyl-3-methyl-5-hydroxy-6-metoxy-1,4-benzoquinol methylase
VESEMSRRGMTAPSDEAGAHHAQDFWLSHLGQADNFNRWIFSCFAGWLKGDVVEVGCGTGNFTALIAATGCSVLGVDIEPRYVDAAQRALSKFPNARFAQMDITESQLSPSFDTAVMLDVLEHIEDEVGLLRSLHGSLRDGGHLILKVPAGPALYSQMDKAIGHCRRYTRASLGRALRSASFVPVTIMPVNTLGILGWWLNGKILKRVTPPAGQIGVFNKIVPLAAALERRLRLPFGLSYLALATKTADGVHE